MIQISSPAFPDHGQIPRQYTCDGYGVSPPLSWTNVPENTRSIAILVDDPGAPSHPFLHWLVTDLPPEIHELEEGGALPHESNVAESDAGTASYYGPCPTQGVHHYRFHIYALDTVLGHRPESGDQFLDEIDGHVLDEGELVGLYERASA